MNGVLPEPAYGVETMEGKLTEEWKQGTIAQRVGSDAEPGNAASPAGSAVEQESFCAGTELGRPFAAVEQDAFGPFAPSPLARMYCGFVTQARILTRARDGLPDISDAANAKALTECTCSVTAAINEIKDHVELSRR